jgi:hypothetical protein
MKKMIFISLFILNNISLHAQDSSSVKLYPFWTFIIPGATHFYNHRISEGLLFSTFELGLVGVGIAYNNNLKEQSNSPYYNFPLLLGLNAWAVDKCDFARNQLEYYKYRKNDFRYDDVPFNELLKEPFRPRNLFSWLTGSFVLLAVIELCFESMEAEHSIKKVAKFHFIDRYIEKTYSVPLYGTVSLAASWEAGVAEEYWMRNYLMPLWDYKFGQNKGLLLSSGFFGAMHAFNYLFVDDPDPLTILYHVGFASLVGYVLGKHVQINNYKIGKAVAAHTWYDFTLILGSFLVNPKENVFGVSLKLKL